MAKESGVGWEELQVDDSGGTLRDISDDVLSFQFATPRGVADVTGVGQSAMDRLLLLVDFSITMTAAFNDASNRMHDVFKTIPSTSVAREVLIGHSGQRLGLSPQMSILLTDYALNRSQDGNLVATVPGVLTGGVVPTWTTP